MKYALITGAAGGLAGACVEELNRRGGWKIYAVDYNMDGLNDLVARTSEDVIPIQVDISNMDSVNAMAEEVKKTTDHLDVVVNAAGIHTMASLVEGNPSAIMERMININVLGMIRMNQAIFPLVKDCKGRIINFSSECGWEQPQPFNSPYAITKWAVEAYNIGLRRELAFIDVPVIKIQPGSFKTGMHGQANAGYAKLLETTEYYKPVLTVLAPLMTIAMAHPNDKKYLVETVMEAIFAEKPKQNYKCKNTWYLGLIDPIPGTILDPAYKAVVGTGYKIMKLLGKA